MAGYFPVKKMEEKGGQQQQGSGSAGGDSEAHFKQELLTAVKTDDEEKLRHALKHLPEKAVNHIFPIPESTTALHIAAKNNSLALINTLLEAAADPNIKDLTGNKYCPLHYAAVKGHPEAVNALLKNGANPNAKEGEYSRTALHLLTNVEKNNEDPYKECLDALLASNKTRVDIADQNNCTPLFLAASKGWEYMVRRLIYKGADIKAAMGKKTAEDVIKKKFPDLLDSIDFSAIEVQKRNLSDDLYNALNSPDIELFRDILGEIDKAEPQAKKSALEEDHGNYTLLQHACENGLTDFVDELLKHGADPTHSDQMSPCLYAARNGYYEILNLLLSALREKNRVKEALRQRDRRNETVLHKVVKREYISKNEGVDYYKCLELLLEKKQNKVLLVDLDAQDEFGCTPLHYAVYCDDQSFVRILLRNGANLGIRNDFGTLAITRIQPAILEEVLNDCIKYTKNINISDREFEIILQYSMLAPTQTSQQPETECLRFISESSKHRRLLRHPVIDTFSFLKWQKIKAYYYFNIMVYTLFLVLLTAYVLLFHGTFIPAPTGRNSSEPSDQNKTELPAEVAETIENNLVPKVILQFLIILCTLYLVLREGVQFYVSWKIYVSKLENWLEISIIVLTCMVLFMPIDTVSLQSMCAWLILFSWIEFMLLIGRHPFLSIYISMFTKVTQNFLILILLFSSMIIAFSISFFLVFQVDNQFKTYYQSLLKTIAMATGEIEYTDLPLDAFPVSSHLLFVVFVFLIILVLMNLLNGLAVSDIQQIQQEAEIMSYRSRVDLVSYIESVFLASPLHQVFPKSLRCCEGGDEERDRDDCSLNAGTQTYNPVMRLLNRLGRRTLMFQTCFNDSASISLYPNRVQDRWEVCPCHRFKLEETHIEAAKDVVLEKEHAAVSHRMSDLQSRMDEIMAAVSTLTEKVDRHVLCPSPH